MPISFKKYVAVLRETCSIEDSERLLSALVKAPDRAVDLTDLKNVHTAVLQVLMACRPRCIAAPEDEELSIVLAPVLNIEPSS